MTYHSMSHYDGTLYIIIPHDDPRCRIACYIVVRYGCELIYCVTWPCLVSICVMDYLPYLATPCGAASSPTFRESASRVVVAWPIIFYNMLFGHKVSNHSRLGHTRLDYHQFVAAWIPFIRIRLGWCLDLMPNRGSLTPVCSVPPPSSAPHDWTPASGQTQIPASGYACNLG